MLNSPAKPLCLFLALSALNPDNNNGLYNLTNENKSKWGIDTAFINSYSLVGNHDYEEVDLSFVGYKCPLAVKFNQLWQLDLLDPKLVGIIKAISLVAALFWDPSFAFCTCQTMKLVFKLGLRTNKIKNSMVKEKIEAVLVNRTVNLLNRLFRDNPE